MIYRYLLSFIGDTCSSHNCTGAACLVTTRGATPTVHCVGYRNAGCMGEKCLPDAEDCIKEGWEDCSGYNSI